MKIVLVDPWAAVLLLIYTTLCVTRSHPHVKTPLAMRADDSIHATLPNILQMLTFMLRDIGKNGYVNCNFFVPNVNVAGFCRKSFLAKRWSVVCSRANL